MSCEKFQIAITTKSYQSFLFGDSESNVQRSSKSKANEQQKSEIKLRVKGMAIRHVKKPMKELGSVDICAHEPSHESRDDIPALLIGLA